MKDRINILLSALAIVLVVCIGFVVVTQKQYFGFAQQKSSVTHVASPVNQNVALDNTVSNSTDGGPVKTSVNIINPTTEATTTVNVTK